MSLPDPGQNKQGNFLYILYSVLLSVVVEFHLAVYQFYT